jgi:hypothetical protein
MAQLQMPISPEIKNPLLSNMNTDIKQKIFVEKDKNNDSIHAMEISETSICGDLLKTECKSGSNLLTEQEASKKNNSNNESDQDDSFNFFSNKKNDFLDLKQHENCQQSEISKVQTDIFKEMSEKINLNGQNDIRVSTLDL